MDDDIIAERRGKDAYQQECVSRLLIAVSVDCKGFNFSAKGRDYILWKYTDAEDRLNGWGKN